MLATNEKKARRTLGNSHAQQTDGTSSEDGHGVSSLDLGESANRVDTDSKRLNESSVLERHRLGDVVGDVRGKSVISSEGSRGVGRGSWRR
jgi:hypothetical protein